jgi:hypothetical protein
MIVALAVSIPLISPKKTSAKLLTSTYMDPNSSFNMLSTYLRSDELTKLLVVCKYGVWPRKGSRLGGGVGSTTTA